LPDGTKCDLLSLPDLVRAKQTQRDEDWPMIRRLVEAHYFLHQTKPRAAQIKFWLAELRTPQLLLELARAHGRAARQFAVKRPLLKHAISARLAQLEQELLAEETGIRIEDKAYWLPLREELEKLRHAK
jgi:hypothetical protein